MSSELYAATFLQRIACTRKASTHEGYKQTLHHHLFPTFQGLDLRDITREKVKALAMAGLQDGLSAKTVQNVLRCLSSLFSHAIEDGLANVNPALKPGMFLPKISKRRKISPLTCGEVAMLLDTAKAPTITPCCSVPPGLDFDKASSWRCAGRTWISMAGS